MHEHVTAPRTALVTGAGRGLGRGLALGLLAAGWDVALVGRDRAHLEEVAGQAGHVEGGGQARQGRAVVVPFDVTDAEAVRAGVRTAEEELGGLGLLVNNAGVVEQREVAFAEDDLADAWRVVEVNVRGPMTVIHAALPGMLAQGGGRIVNINSGAAYKRSETYTAYGISKGALARVTTILDAQYREQGIRTFDLAPGVVRTDMTESMPMHDDRAEWTDVAVVVEMLLALASGELDGWSGRFVRAGADTPDQLAAHVYDVAVHDARVVRLVPWGGDDPLRG